MDGQNETPAFRRGLWMVLWFVVAVVVLWVLAWLIFFRSSSPKPSDLQGSNTKHSQPNNSGSSTKKPSDGSSNDNSSSSVSSGSSGTTTQSSRLANAGAGNVLVPFGIAVGVGGTLYQVRLRKRAKA